MDFLQLFTRKVSATNDQDARWEALVELFTSEETFIAEGSGNGVLHLEYLADESSPDGRNEELPFDFMPWDWTALYKGRFSVPDEPWKNEDVYSEWDARQLALHREFLKQYPLLGRITGIYNDAIYSSHEIPDLITECNGVSTRDLYAMRALAKIRLAAEKAHERGSGIVFSAD